MGVNKPCQKCFGLGQVYDGKVDDYVNCNHCNGTGVSLVKFNPIDDD